MRLRGSLMQYGWVAQRQRSRRQRRQRRDDVHIVSTRTNRPQPAAPTNHQPPTNNHQPTSQSTTADRTNQPPRTNHRHAKLSITICHHHHAHGRDDVRIVSTNEPSANNCNTQTPTNIKTSKQ